MFSRNPDRSEDPRRSAALPGTGLREPAPSPVASTPTAPLSDESLIAREDSFEGKLRTTRGVRIAGTLRGSVESSQYVHIDENAKVEADITAEEVIISGTYSGKLVCRQRLEIRATGRVSGELETVRLMLHEGGYVDGELHMQKAPTTERASASDPRGSRRQEAAASSAASTRETSAPAASAGSASSAPAANTGSAAAGGSTTGTGASASSRS